MAIQPPIPKGPSNQTGLGATPGTQQVAQKNVSGGGFNPNMPVGAQLAKQAASSYQQSLLPGGTAAKGSGATGGALPTPTGTPGTALKGPPGSSAPAATSGTPATGRPVVTQGTVDPTKGYNIFSGMDPQQIQKMNEDMGLSNLFNATRPEEEPKSILLMQTTEDPPEGISQEYWDTLNDKQKKYLKWLQESKAEIEDVGSEYPEQEESYEGESYDLQSAAEDEGPPDTSSDVKDAMEGSEGYVDYLEQQADSGPGTVDDYQGVDDDLGGTNIDAMEEAIEAWTLESEGDAIGLDPYKKQAAMDQLDAKYATHLQQVLAGLDRQAAMAGTFGSAAHTMNINTAISGAMQQMAGEFMELEKMDLAAVEEDYAEIFSQMVGASDQYAKIENLDMQLESLNQAAYKMGLDKFAQEIQSYLATGKITNDVIATYQKEIDQLIQLGLLDLESWKAGVNAEEAEILLEQASDNIALEYEKQLLETSKFYGEKLAGEMETYVTYLKEQYSGAELSNAMNGLLAIFAATQAELAGGGDYDSLLESLNQQLKEYFSTVLPNIPG